MIAKEVVGVPFLKYLIITKKNTQSREDKEENWWKLQEDEPQYSWKFTNGLLIVYNATTYCQWIIKQVKCMHQGYKNTVYTCKIIRRDHYQLAIYFLQMTIRFYYDLFFFFWN